MKISNALLLSAIVLLFFLIGEATTRLFWKNTLQLEITESGFYYFTPNQIGSYDLNCHEIKVNEHGLRGGVPNGEKVVFVGDSFTFGWCVDDSETIPYYYEQLTGKETLNLANCGYGIEHMIESYNYFSGLVNAEDKIYMVIIREDFNRPMIKTNRYFFWVREHSSFFKFLYSRYKVVEAAFRLTPDFEYLTNDQKDMLYNFSIGKELYLVFYEFEHTAYSDNAMEFCKEYNLSCITDVYNAFNSTDRYVFDGKHPSSFSNMNFASYIVFSIK